MKSSLFVGLYAVGQGESNPDNVNKKAVYIHCLYCSNEFRVSPQVALPLLANANKGLYIGIVEQTTTLGVKVIQMKEENQTTIDGILPKEVLDRIYNTMGVLFGSGSSGEPTQEYVNQDR